MKQFISILTGSLLVFVSFVNAEEIASSETVQTEQQPQETQTIDEANKVLEELTQTENPAATESTVVAASETASETAPEAAQVTPEVATEQSATPAVDVVSPEANTQPAAQNNPPQAKPKKESIWDKFLNLFKASEPKAKTCEEAFNEMNGISINFANTTDFAISGDKYMDLRYQKIKETNSFNTRSSNLYVDISNLNVEASVITAFIGKWSKIFAQDKKTVLWNLSDNKLLGDDVIDNIDLSNTYSLNLANTSVSDLTVTKIVSILGIQNNGMPVCINLSGTKVSDAAVESLKAALQKAKTEFESKNPGKTYSLEGENNSGVIFKKLPNFLKPTSKKTIPDKSAVAPVETIPAVAPTATAAPTADATAEQSLDVGTAGATETPVTDVAVPETSTQDATVSGETAVPSDSTENVVSGDSTTETAGNNGTAPLLVSPNESNPSTDTSGADAVLSEADKIIAETESVTTATEATA